ncbi:right-handed parallel beta-helix repeat-containing protein [Kitasatospora indigofera]|uniref:right-handed parallel beta-helix repeat-containing protein n=1 Tax=Kitasatospora indigofera TaxID=67307 RepID=UPI0036BDE9B8
MTSSSFSQRPRCEIATQPITYQAHPGSKPVLRPVTSWDGINIVGASYIKVTGLEIAGNAPRLALDAAEHHALSDDALYNTNCLTVRRDKPGGPIPHDVEIAGNDFHGCPGGGISAIDADGVTIRDNRVHDNSWYAHYATSGISVLRALDASPGDPQTYKIRITGNTVYGNQTKVKWSQCDCYSDGNGIIVDTNKEKPAGTGDDYQGRTLVADNVVFDNGGSGIHAFKSQHVDIVNNTAYQNSASPHLKYGNVFGAYSRDVRILNNIAVARPGLPVNSNSQNQDVTYDYNLYFAGTAPRTTGPHDLVADPKFLNPTTDPSAADFRLRPGSPALGTGTPFAAVPRDVTGAARTPGQAYDRGAYASSAAGTTAATPAGPTSGSASAPVPKPAASTTTPPAGANSGTEALPGVSPSPTPSAEGFLAQTGFTPAPVIGAAAALAGGIAVLVVFRRRRPAGSHGRTRR